MDDELKRTILGLKATVALKVRKIEQLTDKILAMKKATTQHVFYRIQDGDRVLGWKRVSVQVGYAQAGREKWGLSQAFFRDCEDLREVKLSSAPAGMEQMSW